MITRNSSKILIYNRLSLRTSTWTKDTQGLYAYDVCENPQNFQVGSQTCYLVRMGKDKHEAKLVDEKNIKTIPTEDSVLLKIIPPKLASQKYIIENYSTSKDYDETRDKLWLVIKCLIKDGKKKV